MASRGISDAPLRMNGIFAAPAASARTRSHSNAINDVAPIGAIPKGAV
jgi:hypothetical protein